VCNCCLSNILSAVFQLVGQGMGGHLATAAIAVQAEENDPEEG
jgi:hypothetical protein